MTDETKILIAYTIVCAFCLAWLIRDTFAAVETYSLHARLDNLHQANQIMCALLKGRAPDA
jgi:hypothetical protein